MHDSHVHLSLSPIKENLGRIITDFTKDNGKYILDMGTEPDNWFTALETKRNITYKNTIYTGIGIHPTIYTDSFLKHEENTDTFKYSQKILSKLDRIYAENSKDLDAVGETGLDYYQMYKDKLNNGIIKDIKEIQKNSFRKHCSLAVKYDLPLSIHARELYGKDECVKDTLKIIAEEGKGTIKGIFHSYTGTLKGLEMILDMGFFVGFNSIITYPSGENVREILKNTPIKRIVFETDGPFLPTQKTKEGPKTKLHFGKPADIREILKKASEIKDIPMERLEEETDHNFELLFNIPSN